LTQALFSHAFDGGHSISEEQPMSTGIAEESRKTRFKFK
jgi:hypothetical protein